MFIRDEFTEVTLAFDFFIAGVRAGHRAHDFSAAMCFWYGA